MAGTLEGIRVLELASYVTGPFASMLLADLGAEVIKVEERERGDPFRGWGERLYSATFCSLNRNKKSVTLDIRSDEGRDVCRRLAAEADVLIENHRPGVMARRGLGYDDVRPLNPGIIYCSISGFGQDANNVHASNIIVYAVGVGSNIPIAELNAIASDPDSQFVRLLSTFNVTELRDLQESLDSEACQGKITYYCCITMTLMKN